MTHSFPPLPSSNLKDRLADQIMADLEFGELRDRGDGDDILVSEAVAGVRFDAVLPRERGGIGEAAQFGGAFLALDMRVAAGRSEEHTSELQSLMRHSYAVCCLKKKKQPQTI